MGGAQGGKILTGIGTGICAKTVEIFLSGGSFSDRRQYREFGKKSLTTFFLARRRHFYPNVSMCQSPLTVFPKPLLLCFTFKAKADDCKTSVVEDQFGIIFGQSSDRKNGESVLDSRSKNVWRVGARLITSGEKPCQNSNWKECRSTKRKKNACVETLIRPRLHWFSHHLVI